MSETIETYQALKRAAEAKQREADRAAGALQQTMARLKKEFGVSSLKEAEKELTALTEERDSTSVKLKRELAELQKKWSKALNE